MLVLCHFIPQQYRFDSAIRIRHGLELAGDRVERLRRRIRRRRHGHGGGIHFGDVGIAIFPRLQVAVVADLDHRFPAVQAGVGA